MRRSLAVLFAAACAIVAMSAMAGASTTATTTHKWKFAPTINAPWAMEDDEGELDAPDLAAGLCRSAPVNLPGAYAPFGPSEVDAIVGDPVNNSGFSNFGCTTPQNETSHRRQSARMPRTSSQGRTTIASAATSRALNDGTGWAYYSFDGGEDVGQRAGARR